MKKDDRVLHKSGSKGTVKEVTREWVYVALDGSSMVFPYKAEWLEVIEGEGDHGQQSSD